MHKINLEWTHPVLDYAMSFISNFRLLKFPLALAVAALIFLGGFRERLLVFLMLLCLLIGDAGINWMIKKAACRPRPHEAVAWVKTRDFHLNPLSVETRPAEVTFNPRGRSMPSGHVVNNVALAILVTLFYPRLGPVFWVWAVLMGYSRIYVGSHYPSDVAVSFLLAALYTPAIAFGFRYLWMKHRFAVVRGLQEKYPDPFYWRVKTHPPSHVQPSTALP
ncbi:MAG: phosphatase PAP2 family protein [Verrucomicrobiae bacterium]|nr:phosphatase PAP2 family protein [Verrucomicrobiae bacterium]